ncbi:MAG TPA: FecR family protein [Terriglobia bacterium]|nr:FecR family protein [Terriglobia bacterium]
MKTARLYLPVTLIVASSCAAAICALAEDGEYSRARIVRLSFVEGTVTVLRPASDWANAPVNTPIQEGFQLSTDKDSFAEVQFENGSTARVGELALLKFDQLGLTEAGDALNRMVLDHGYGTFRALNDKLGTFEVQSGDATFKAQGKSEFRVDAERGQVRLEVLKGSIDVSSPEITTTLAKDAVLELTPGSETAYNLKQGVQRDDWDDWVAERDQQEAAATPPGGAMAGAPTYGWSDLNQYGTWSYFDGNGYGWVPDAMGPWSPYSLGQWNYSPGFGYMWNSYEPWGWLPYMYGGWGFDPLFGWAWFPGNFWGWNGAPVNWYSGSGWIGWTPRPPVGSTGLGAGLLPPAKPCPGGATGCVHAVNIAKFQKGGPILPQDFIKVKPGEGLPVKTPPVSPAATATLFGRPARLSSAQQAVISGRPVTSEHFFARLSPVGHQWNARAPQSTIPSPPAEVRGTQAGAFWGRGSAVSYSGDRSGFGASRGVGSGVARGGGGSFGRGEGGGGSHSGGGGISAGGGGMSAGGGGGMSAGGGGGHGGGGGGGGHH